MNYYFDVTVSGRFDDVVQRVVTALKQQGFGVLTDIDVKETLKQKIGVEFRPLSNSRRLQSAACPQGTHRRGQDRHYAAL